MFYFVILSRILGGGKGLNIMIIHDKFSTKNKPAEIKYFIDIFKEKVVKKNK